MWGSVKTSKRRKKQKQRKKITKILNTEVNRRQGTERKMGYGE